MSTIQEAAMKIQSSNVLMTSQHVAVKEQSKSESLKVWIGNRRPDFEKIDAALQAPSRDSVDLSQEARNVASIQNDKGRSVRSRGASADKAEDTDSTSKFINILMELITGRKVKVKTESPQEETVDPEKAAELTQAASQAQAALQPQTTQQQPASTGFGLEYDSRETTLEAESMSFSAQGVVKTADGAQIDFKLQLSMQRVFASEQTTSIRLGDAVQQQDPLVINFDGTAAQLTDTKFSFDLDMDGADEQISFVGPNSGFIALDKNNDGTVNDGSELFGTVSGNGFQDLAAYDQDKNGWIDDNDAVFNQLQVWTKDAAGNDSLTGLKLSGVGALYLGNISTQFDLKTASNESLGTVRASSVYLNENGSVGTLQDVDLTV
jgi:hypothetical protein